MDNKCIICLDITNDPSDCTRCKYYVHQDCMNEWYKLNNNKCLICKSSNLIKEINPILKNFEYFITSSKVNVILDCINYILVTYFLNNNYIIINGPIHFILMLTYIFSTFFIIFMPIILLLFIMSLIITFQQKIITYYHKIFNRNPFINNN
jgi:hypothetical protein